MWKKLALISFVLWILTAGTFVYFFTLGQGAKTDDGRMSVKLTLAEKNIVLQEMRSLLSGVQTILEALTVNDLKLVEKTATSIGMGAAADVHPGLMVKLPLDFKQTGFGLHGRFDDLALRVHQGAQKEEVLKEVSDIMRTCVGCHEAYRLDESH